MGFRFNKDRLLGKSNPYWSNLSQYNKKTPYLAYCNKLKYGVHDIKSDHISAQECGSNITTSVINYNTRKMQEKLGIEFNSLRHIQRVKVKEIQVRLCYRRSVITIDTYSHLMQKMQNESVDIFEQAIRDLI